MRWRVFFFVSLGVNLALAAWIFSSRPENAPSSAALSSPSALQSVRTNVVLRRQFFSWDQIESPEYPTYISNLRAIGCPEQTVRDIIIAEVNAVYARRLATELVTPEQQWWRSEPDTNVVRAAAVKTRELNLERRALLAQLLGPAWEGGDLVSLPRPSRPGVPLDGPVLGTLSDDVKQAIEEISVRSQERLQAWVDEQRETGGAADPAELARLRRQTRDELANLLTPLQLEEYLLRYSQNANDLRAELGQLQHFNATPDEFRAMFRAADAFDEQIAMLSGKEDHNSVLQRRTLEQQRDQAIRNVLGPRRYREYALLHDPAYQDAVVAAREAGTPEAADTIYQINLATAREEALTRADPNLTEQQRAIRLKEIELEQMKAATLASGQEVPAPLEQPPLPTVIESQAPRMSTHPYVLGVGDTVASVAIRYNVSMEDLRAANPDVDLRRLRAGDSILVPDTLQTR